MKPALLLLSVLFATTLIALILTQSEPAAEVSQLEKAAAFVKACSTERHIRQNEVFLNMEGKHYPSRWTEYFLSVFSTRNWALEGSKEANIVAGTIANLDACTIKPKGVRFVLEDTAPLPAEIGEPAKYELVVWADDKKNFIGVTGYEASKDEPVLEQEWPFPNFEK